MKKIRISHPSGILNGHIRLDGSKSISNRALIIKALCKGKIEIDHLSGSDDTKILSKLLFGTPGDLYDVGHAGTTFRFLTAFLSLKKGTQILTGSSRMKERPIGPLVDALRSLGCVISYLENEGYPPLNIGEPTLKKGLAEIEIDAGISSQYLTALLLIAPVLPGGLRLLLKGKMVSESYLNLTLGILSEFGIAYQRTASDIRIENQNYRARRFTVEADWSACSYYFSLVALSKQANLSIDGLFEKSFQGDAAMTTIGRPLGVHSHFENGQLHLTKKATEPRFEYNFINQPDAAQTCAVVCSALKIKSLFSGLKTLKIKETDRIYALNRELAKIGGGFVLARIVDDEEFYKVIKMDPPEGAIPLFETYKDHRMAMSFAPLALLMKIEIEHPAVVSKSYPAFWEDLKSLGFEIYPVSE